jgi:hypothetical protein
MQIQPLDSGQHPHGSDGVVSCKSIGAYPAARKKSNAWQLVAQAIAHPDRHAASPISTR